MHSGRESSVNYFVDFGPSCLNTRDVIQDIAVFPKWSFLYIVDEADGTEIHIPRSLSGYSGGFGHVAWVRSSR